jgi:hypothetical protein
MPRDTMFSGARGFGGAAGGNECGQNQVNAHVDPPQPYPSGAQQLATAVLGRAGKESDSTRARLVQVHHTHSATQEEVHHGSTEQLGEPKGATVI